MCSSVLLNLNGVGFSAITRLELFGYPDLQPAEETALQIVIAELEEIAVTANIVDRAIQIRKQSRVKTPDAIIATTAMEVGAVLVTRNENDFKKVNGLKLINPWID